MRTLLPLLLGWLLLACPALAQQPVPELDARVTDLTGTLGEKQVATLSEQLRQLEADTGGQLAVLVVASTAPEDIAAYAIRVVDQWQLGREKFDDGVLFLVAKEDRRMRIEVGYGLEGAITDAQARRIIDGIVAPHFRKGDFYAGIAAGTGAIDKLIRGEGLPAPTAEQRKRGGEPGNAGAALGMLIVLLFVLGPLARALFGRPLGSALAGGAVGLLTYAMLGTLVLAVILAVFAGAFSLISGAARWSDHDGPGGGFLGGMGGGFGGGLGGGGFGGGGFGGGGFGGGGGGFGGGGASGGW